MIDIPKLKPLTSKSVELCGHALAEGIAGAVSFQAAESSRLTSHSTLLCARCALAVSEAVMAAVMSEHAERRPL